MYILKICLLNIGCNTGFPMCQNAKYGLKIFASNGYSEVCRGSGQSHTASSVSFKNTLETTGTELRSPLEGFKGRITDLFIHENWHLWGLRMDHSQRY